MKKNPVSRLIAALICLSVLLVGCSGKPEGTESATRSTMRPTEPADVKKAISGTEFAQIMEKNGADWRGDTIYPPDTHSDDETKITEIREYAICVDDGYGAYYDIMEVVYIKSMDSAASENYYSGIANYYSDNCSSVHIGENYKRAVFDNIEGSDYAIICVIDNTIIMLLSYEDDLNAAEKIMQLFGY